MSRASTAKPPALAMPSRRAAVSAGFPVRRRRPDAGDCRHQGEYAGACPFWTGSLFLCLFSFFLLPKGRDLPKHGLRGGLFRIRAGRAGESPRPGRRPQARPALRGAMPYGAEGCRMLVPLPVEREAACGAGPGGTGRLLRMDGKRRPAHAWRNGYCRMGRSSRRALSSRPWLSVDRAERAER